MLHALFFTLAAVQSNWTPHKLFEALGSPSNISAESEAELARWFGDKSLDTGADAKVDDLGAAWAIRAPEGAKEAVVRSIPDKTRLNMVRIGKGRLFAAANKFPEGTAFRYYYEIDGKPIGNPREIELYKMPPESRPDPGIPSGKLDPQPQLTSQIFGGTKHDWWLYTPAGFDPSRESNLVVFQDGQWAHNYGPIYFDHLIAQKQLPQTVVVFVTPGTFPDGKSDRSREYDTLSDAYARFLVEELLPPVEAKFKITQDPMRRCVAGISSGGICSFTVAWEKPEKFGLVMSWVGSFTNLQGGPTGVAGGNTYPAIIRALRGWDQKGAQKPIRILLQDGANDLDNKAGNWPLANQEMAKALEFGGYDYKFVFGQGFHSDRHGRATMADALRWLFRPSK